MPSVLGKKMLIIVAKRGYTGADREVFFHHIRGIKYAELEKEVTALEKEGLISIEWVGPSNFTVSITPKGVELAKSYQQDAWRKSAEALKQLKKEKHHGKSIVHEEVGYSRMIEDKMGVQEVGAISEEITEKLDEHIKSEREASTEEVTPAAISVPAVEEVVENEVVEGEKGLAERRISGEQEKKEVTSEGKKIPLPPKGFAKETQMESRIAVEKGKSIDKSVRERRLSGRAGPRTPAVKTEKGKEVTTQKPEAPSPGIEEKPSPGMPPPLKDFDEETTSTSVPTEQVPAPPVEENETKVEAETAPVVSSTEMRCLWEVENECPILKGKEFGMNLDLTPNHCIVCQLVKIKQLLKK